MSDEVNDAPVLQGAIAKVVMEPLSYALAAGCRRAIEVGVPPTMILELLLNHLCSVVAMIEPAGARASLIQDLVRDIAPLCNKHIDARMTSPGGVILPRR